MDFFVKRTNEMTGQEQLQLLELFNKVFDKDRPIEVMLNQYTQNPIGYSYHSFFMEDGAIKGAITCIPAYYLYRNEQVKIATIVDAMVAEENRDLFSFLHVLNNAYKELKKEGYSFVYCYPNEDAYMVYTKAKSMHEIGRMRTYCLLYRIGGVKKPLKVMNFLSEGFAWGWVWLAGLLANNKRYEGIIHKEDESYNATRYKRSDGRYDIVQIDDFTLYYKIREQEGVRTAFIIDIDKKSAKNFNKSLKYLIKIESSNFDLILYPGLLPFSLSGLVPLPRVFERKKFYMVGKILDNKIKKEDAFTIMNWDTNLSNYDII